MSRTGSFCGVLALCVCLVTLAASGCDIDECESHERRCDGSVLLTCFEPSCHVPGCMFNTGRYWSRQTCSACIENKETAFCALSASEDPVCQRTDRCEDNAAVNCIGGHATARLPCDDRVCVTTGWGEPFCAQSSTPHPLCDTLMRTQNICEDSTLLSCYGRHVHYARACQFACVTLGDDAFCAAADSTDPRCEVPVEQRMSVSCPDESPGVCRDGFIECIISPDVEVDIDAGSG